MWERYKDTELGDLIRQIPGGSLMAQWIKNSRLLSGDSCDGGRWRAGD